MENEIKHSEKIGALGTALAKAQGEMAVANKSGFNPHFQSTYADLSDIINCIKGPLSKYGLAFVQFPFTAEDRIVGVRTLIIHGESNEWMEDTLTLKATKDDAQGMGSALTYARRYSLQSIFGIPADDDDGNAASKTVSKTQALKNSKEQVKLDAECVEHFTDKISNVKTIEELVQVWKDPKCPSTNLELAKLKDEKKEQLQPTNPELEPELEPDPY